MPTIRDGRGVLHVHDMGTPPTNPPPPIERRQASAERMADFAAERARAAEKRDRPVNRTPVRQTAAEIRASSERGTERSRQVRQERAVKSAANGEYVTVSVPEEEITVEGHHDVGTNRIRQQQEAGARAAVEGSPDKAPRAPSLRYPLPRDHEERDAKVIAALRAHPNVKAAAAELGVSETRVGQVLKEIRLAGRMPADLDAVIKSRSANAAATVTGRAPLVAMVAELPDKSTITAADLPESPWMSGPPAEPDASSMHISAPDLGTTGAAPAEVLATPPGPDLPAGAEMRPAWAILRALDLSIEGEDRCSYARLVPTSSVLHVCDRRDGHEGAHRGRLMTVLIQGSRVEQLGHMAVPA